MAIQLQAQGRSDLRNSSTKRIREEGNIPAIINGNNGSKPIFVNSIEFLKTIRESGRNGIIQLVVDNENHPVMLNELQRDPVKGEYLHADFKVINMNTKVDVEVRVNLVGEALGVKDGGVLQQSIHQVSITALPANIPQAIDVDVTNLEVGQTVLVSDVQTGGKYELNHEQSEVIASIQPPKQEEEIDTGEEQEEGIPESEEGRETSEG
ncbi:50S ribosomal protein L25/general stress protein Ctc [Cytobacillus suaedae]|nr:50S ribosomal protein L25/general stress protein Ctc [Cytobacillus suaedae]